MSQPATTRRDFLATGLAAMAGAGLSAAFTPVLGRAVRPADKIRLGLIGTGSRGAGLATLIREMPDYELIACCDIIPENLQKGLSLAAKNAKGYSDYRKLLDDKSIDAVVIATPLYLHYPMAVAALQAGKHIYLEKSMTYDIPQAIDLVKKVKASGLVFQIGYQYRYYGLYHLVKEIMKEKWLGRITHF